MLATECLLPKPMLHAAEAEQPWNILFCFADDWGRYASCYRGLDGRATLTTDFATFNMTKPSLARLLSVDDKIELEIEFRTHRTAA